MRDSDIEMGNPYEHSAYNSSTNLGVRANLLPDSMESAMASAMRKNERLTDKQRRKVVKIFIGILSFLVFVILLLFFTTRDVEAKGRDASKAAHTGFYYDSGFNMQHNWGSYSPYFDSGSPFDGISRSSLDGELTLPNKCELRQVHLLHRHGNRYPSGKTSSRMMKVARKLKHMSEPPTIESLDWLEDWEYLLGEDLLVGSGVGAMFTSGAKFWGSHGRLLYGNESKELLTWSDDINVYPNGTARHKPLLRTTTQSRMQDSAKAWAAGFFGTYGNPSTGNNPLDHYDLLLIAEEEKSNNTLASSLACPNYEAENAINGNLRSKAWVHKYLKDAATRIQSILPGYDNITATEVLALQDICVFETAAYGQSGFCGLFTEQEWRGYEYHLDLKFYGDSAWGTTVGPATGLSWVKELHSRLTQTPIATPQFGVNVTLDSSSETFPLDQPFYADFTHDNIIITVLSALQFQFTKPELSSKKIKVPRQFIISRLTPFAARMYIEIMRCEEDKEFVRMKLNDRVLPIGELRYCHEDEDGLCPLQDFIKSVEWALNKIDYDDICFGEHYHKPWEEL